MMDRMLPHTRIEELDFAVDTGVASDLASSMGLDTVTAFHASDRHLCLQ